ncbi:MAG: AMP-binding protein, partial [Eubacteriaceae bacterium]|nr:AMP-binding protein [Eubacteriaceae bacterium]
MKNRVRVQNLQATLQADEYTDMRALLIDKCKKYENNVAFTIKHKHGKTVLYENISYKEYFEKMVNFINGMVESGFGGKRLAIIGNNSMEWTIGYFGQICGNGIVIPLDKGLPYEELVSSLNRSYADVLLFDVAHKELIEQLISGGDCRNLEFICMNEAAGYMTMNEMIEIGKRAK